MRRVISSSLTLSTLLLMLLLVGTSQAGLMHRRFRAVLQPQQTSSEPKLHPDRIPVTIIQDDQILNAPNEQRKVLEAAATIVTEAPQLAAAETDAIAESIAKAVETEQNLRVIDAVIEAERQQEEQIVQQEIKDVIQEQNKELLQAAAGVANAPVAAAEIAIGAAPTAALQHEIKLESAAAETATPLETLPLSAANDNKLKAVLDAADSVADAAQTAETAQNVAATAESDDQVSVVVAVDGSSVRQATQATPTQSTTQQNFVQQLIQNSPLGQLFNQLTGQQQLQAAQQTTQVAQAGQVAADEPVAPIAPAAPTPTLPGFLNPQNAITQAQQAVQNAAQSVVNATTQAFQGVQQFATQIGSQFQNTLSSFGGQQQATADSTTPRPPGPIQAILSNFVGGGGANQPGAAAGAAAAPAQPGQQQGPLQGILSFFQGGNRPQNAAGSSGTVASVAAATPTAVATVVSVAPSQIDDKVDVKKDEVVDQDVEQSLEKEQEQAQPAEQTQPAATYGAGEETDNNNEVRNSAEVGLDSLEDTHPEALIVVNDDANQQHEDATA